MKYILYLADLKLARKLLDRLVQIYKQLVF